MAERFAVNRRHLLTGGAAALAAGAALTQCGAAQSATPATGFGSSVEPFFGPHQAGVATAPQAHALFLALDLRSDGSAAPATTLAAVLRLWTADAARLTQGGPALADTEPELAQRPARLTVTVGLGPAAFDRTGLAGLRPPTAAEPPAFRTDRLDPRFCGGDLLLQICADDPVAVSHASRVLLKNVRAMTLQRWRQTRVPQRPRRRPVGRDDAQPDGPTRRHREPARRRGVRPAGVGRRGGSTLVRRRHRPGAAPGARRDGHLGRVGPRRARNWWWAGGSTTAPR